MYSIGIDMGGTTIKFGLVDESINIVLRKAIKTINPQPILPIAKTVMEIISEAGLKKEQVDKVVVGAPGLVNTAKNTVTSSVMGWNDFSFKNELEKEISLPVEVYNDVNLATMAEVKFGCAKDYKNAVMLTFGTGVGGGIIIDGKLCLGNEGMGAEIGHMTFREGGRLCGGCVPGRRGCYQSYASATALCVQAKEMLEENKDSSLFEAIEGNYENLNGEVILKEYIKKDKTTVEIVEKYVLYVSEGIVSICNFLRPQVVILGGGISNWGEIFADMVRNYCEKNNYGYLNSPKVEIKIATLKNDAGILGCKAV